MSLFLPFWCSYKVHKCFFFIIETNYNLQSLLIILYILHFFCKVFGAIIKLPLQAFSLFGCTHQLRSPPLLFPHFQLNRRFACVDTSAGWIQKMRGNVVSGWRHYCCILVDGSSHLKAMHTVLLPHIILSLKRPRMVLQKKVKDDITAELRTKKKVNQLVKLRRCVSRILKLRVGKVWTQLNLPQYDLLYSPL